MRFAFTDEQEEFRVSARRFLEKYAPTDAVRKAMESDTGFDDAVWERARAEQGWQALCVPEANDGFGFGMVEQAALMEELGRVVYSGPVLSQFFAARVLVAAGSGGATLSAIARGEGHASVALSEPAGGWGADAVSATAVSEGGAWRLTGEKAHVLDAGIADVFLVVARAPSTSGEDGIGVFVVPACAEGVTVRVDTTMDQTRRKGRVSLDGVLVGADDVVALPGAGWAPVRRALLESLVALACEQVGGAQRCLDDAVEYAGVREQFGRPIGSFQAVKHMCADMMMHVESARSAAWYAAWAADAGDEVAFEDAALSAASYCADAYFFCAAQNVQVHGGVGFTWEYDAHLHFKRATSSKALFGSPDRHRERVAELLLDGGE